MKTIELLRDIQTTHVASPANESIHAVQAPIIDRIDNLLGLGQSMVSHGRVPARSSHSRRRPVRMSSNTSRHKHVEERPQQPLEDLAIIFPDSPTESRESSLHNSQEDPTNSQISANSSTSNPDIGQDAPISPPAMVLKTPTETRRTRQRTAKNNVAASSSTSRREEDNSTENGQQRHLREESYFSAVKPVSDLIYLDFGRQNISRINGYMKTLSGLSPITVVVDQNIEENLISLSFARSCGLEVSKLLKENGDRAVEWRDNERVRCTGSVTVVWSSGPSNQRPFTVPCLACEFGGPGLIFGKSFVEKSEHYQNVRSAETEVNSEAKRT
jgi:hypothetical protein